MAKVKNLLSRSVFVRHPVELLSRRKTGQAVKSPFERRAQKSNDKGQTEN